MQEVSSMFVHSLILCTEALDVQEQAHTVASSSPKAHAKSLGNRINDIPGSLKEISPARAER